jgi:hypothetical protein
MASWSTPMAAMRGDHVSRNRTTEAPATWATPRAEDSRAGDAPSRGAADTPTAQTRLAHADAGTTLPQPRDRKDDGPDQQVAR